MKFKSNTEIYISENVTGVLKRSGLVSKSEHELIKLSGDGSDRSFWLVVLQDGDNLLVVFPSTSNSRAMNEARSCNLIGQHLYEIDVSVPQILFFEEQTGIIIYQYLGALSLYDLVTTQLKKTEQLPGQLTLRSVEIIRQYYLVIDQLIKLQIDGMKGFMGDYCWDSERYDKSVMLEREAGYFINSFCRDFFGITSFEDKLEQEFERLAMRACQEPSDYLLHRDFQSRNIMIHNQRVWIIDFQGARFGPLAYDIASLLNDPYVQLPYEQRELLLDYYISKVSERVAIDRDNFIDGYHHIALLRNLQVLGAFAYLSIVKGKKFFRRHLKPALIDLNYKLAEPLNNDYPILTELVKRIECDKKWENQIYN